MATNPFIYRSSYPVQLAYYLHLLFTRDDVLSPLDLCFFGDIYTGEMTCEDYQRQSITWEDAGERLGMINKRYAMIPISMLHCVDIKNKPDQLTLFKNTAFRESIEDYETWFDAQRTTAHLMVLIIDTRDRKMKLIDVNEGSDVMLAELKRVLEPYFPGYTYVREKMASVRHALIHSEPSGSTHDGLCVPVSYLVARWILDSEYIPDRLIWVQETYPGRLHRYVLDNVIRRFNGLHVINEEKEARLLKSLNMFFFIDTAACLIARWILDDDQIGARLDILSERYPNSPKLILDDILRVVEQDEFRFKDGLLRSKLYDFFFDAYISNSA